VEGKIEVGARVDGAFVRAWVSDNGPGIPAADQERIFEKFTRLRSKNKAGGLGVGLAFCKLAIQGHGGVLRLESEVDKGTTFSFTLPVAQQMRTTGSLVRQTGRLTVKQ